MGCFKELWACLKRIFMAMVCGADQLQHSFTMMGGQRALVGIECVVPQNRTKFHLSPPWCGFGAGCCISRTRLVSRLETEGKRARRSRSVLG